MLLQIFDFEKLMYEKIIIFNKNELIMILLKINSDVNLYKY